MANPTEDPQTLMIQAALAHWLSKFGLTEIQRPRYSY